MKADIHSMAVMMMMMMMMMVMLFISSKWSGNVRLHSSVADLPVGAATWSTPLSPVRLQVSS